uniref:B30.2/SPRY domain-containing protein n=1 Tax=Angiostrongylus cantonensis TaxID=6313 RepID=A0A0K0D7I9_ANGCA
MSSGVHAFDIVWNGPLGMLAVVGVGTRNAYLRCLANEYCSRAGEQYWGWNLANNRLLHGKRRLRAYPRGKNFSAYKQGEKIRLVLDCDRHVVSFENASGTRLGTAFANLPSVVLYPTIWAGQRLADVSIVYIGHPH